MKLPAGLVRRYRWRRKVAEVRQADEFQQREHRAAVRRILEQAGRRDGH
jgi:hypothetical protein